ncbi:MAG: WG repeat-containing protein [Sporomusaceae bacterium]|nr:WG repeat-containing protein [Sporomusaceae bacterium]
MKRLLCGLMAVLLMGATCPSARGESSRYNYNDARTFTVRLPQGERTGLIEIATGRWLIPPRFEAIKMEPNDAAELEKNDSYLAVKLDGKWGFADRAGQVVIQPRYENAYNFSDNLYRVVLNGKIGIIDQTGTMVTEPRFVEIDRMVEGMAVVEENGKFGFVSAGGRVAVEPQFDGERSFSEGLALVRVGDKKGFIDTLGNFVIPPQFDLESNRSFSEGLAAVMVDGKWGFVDRTGRMVIEPQYKNALRFWGGLAAVWTADGLVGFIDNTGRMVVEPQFVSAGYPDIKGEPFLVIWRFFKDGKGEYGYLDSTGRLLDTPRFDNGVNFAEGMAWVSTAGKQGFINTKGELAITPRFSYAAHWFENGIVRAEDGDRKGFIDKSGRWVASGVGVYYPRLNIVRSFGYYCDAEGKLLDHYANHMKDGYHNLKVDLPAEAAQAFRAAIRINPDDEAALYGLKLAGE